MEEYEAALRHPEGLCRDCFQDLWNNIGWHYFRTGNLLEARWWFEQAFVVASCEEMPGSAHCRLALENRMLVYSELGLLEEAAAAVREYFLYDGRVPWPERRALAKLGVDADAM